MANPTTNFNWQMPTSSDLVTDLPADFETFGQAVDTSLADLKGGTTGQVLSKASNTDMDFTWVTSDDANAIQNAIVDAKGDLIAATAADTPARLAVGTNGQVLTADSTAATGLAWATPSAGSSNVAGKNGVLNSGFNVWQRGTSVAGSGSAYNYTADRWQTEASSALTISRQATGDTTNLPFIQYCARVQRNSGSTATPTAMLAQSFETINSIPYVGKTVTFSFYARRGANFSGASNQINAVLQTGTGTDQNIFVGGYTGASNLITQTPTLTTTWQRFSYSATVATTATELGLQFYYTPSGTAGAADYYEVTGVQLEIASSASAYSPATATYQTELAACQRYYERWSLETSNLALAGFNTSTTNGYHVWHFHTKKRSEPTISVNAAGDFSVRTPGGNVTCTAFSTIGQTTDGGWLSTTVASGLGSGNGNFLVNSGVSSFIQASSEL